ncbi:MAG: flagellar biosynthetic protein FliQ [Candidatus Wallbacteria bacterium HGW-Wallbacteria-1]|uniref:Flagellar biosynthetic protein FliQ n=1 Tax=Candidatus Wallbacteria bacterium HGW-Wallbacteria-1 TaxID=2013854 RepID=A0A2N1PSX3_9BACT|nr:MAG: flagellar biosynthetic protein FliQ [Candidatus Wallbacteria bacterium HGW-Wallbacteria-1]
MEPEFVIQLAKDAIWISILMSGPMLAVGMVVGLLVSLFQTTTQIQEQTLTFLPKVVAILMTAIWLGPGMIEKMNEYTKGLLGQLHKLIN